MSLRDKIFAADDIASESVEVSEWGVTVEVRSMTGAARTDLLTQAVDPKTGQVDLRVIYPEIIIACTFDPETGEQLFEAGDREAILAKSAQAVDKIAKVGMRLSGFEEDSESKQASFPETTAS